MDVDINYWAVALAALSSMVVGSIWYSPGVFGKAWLKMTKTKPDPSMNKGMKAVWTYGTVFIASFVTAYIIAHVSFIAHQYFANSFLSDALQTAFWLWLGLTAARIYVHDTFEARRKKLTLLNASHELVTILVMALIIGLMKT